jgi:hypothetical protein
VNRLQRFVWKLRFLRSHAKSLNRRVEVENVLAEVAAGKRPLLTKEECRALAVKLGTLQ